MEKRSLGEIGYEAYRAKSNGRSLISGVEIPEFDKLPQPIKDAWEAAGKEVSGVVLARLRKVLIDVMDAAGEYRRLNLKTDMKEI